VSVYDHSVVLVCVWVCVGGVRVNRKASWRCTSSQGLCVWWAIERNVVSSLGWHAALLRAQHGLALRTHVHVCWPAGVPSFVSFYMVPDFVVPTVTYVPDRWDLV
jgi:hypothetical protein